MIFFTHFEADIVAVAVAGDALPLGEVNKVAVGVLQRLLVVDALDEDLEEHPLGERLVVEAAELRPVGEYAQSDT